MQLFCFAFKINDMPPQLKRLIPNFIVFIGLFLLVRHLLIPDSFGKYGHYRADVLQEIESTPAVFADKEDCHACHSDIHEQILEDAHAEISCLACHGPGNLHVEDPLPGNIAKGNTREFCGRCHEKNAARPSYVVFQVDMETHNIEGDCIDCHNPHQVWEGLE